MQNLCVVIYTHNNFEALKLMLKQLTNQSYGSTDFFIQVILDNCNDHSEELINEFTNLKTLNLSDGVTVGKDQSISILTESLRLNDNIDAYVFLDVNRFIESDFLENVNIALTKSLAITGNTVIIENALTRVEKIKTTYQKYMTNFVRKSRSLFGLSDIVDSNIFAINKKLLDKIDMIDFKDINSELKFSLILSKSGVPCQFAYNVKTYIKIYNFNFEKPSLSKRIMLFKDCFSQLFTLNYKFNEHVFSLISPNIFAIIVLTAFFLSLSFKYYFLFNFSFVFLIFSMLLLGFAISIIKAEIYAKDFLYLLGYPFISLVHILDNLPPYRFIKKLTGFTKKSVKKNVSKYSIRVQATDGKSLVPCKLDLISENGLAKVIFRFKSKNFTTGNHIRMYEAIQELTSKLNEYGFVLKICQCCEYFTSNIDGSKNMVKGFCNFKFKNRQLGVELETVLWNTCPACNPQKNQSIIEEILKDS